MSDITTVWNVSHADYVLAGADLLAGSDLASSVLISLFSDRVASVDDVITDGAGDPRGWHGDQAPYFVGSRLWLLFRSKKTQDTIGRATDYCTEALQWLIDDGVAAGFDVACEWQGQTTLAIGVAIYKANGQTEAMSFSWAWAGVN